MVRLKGGANATPAKALYKFQFLNGAIKRIMPIILIVAAIIFQFLNGAIKRITNFIFQDFST